MRTGCFERIPVRIGLFIALTPAITLGQGVNPRDLPRVDQIGADATSYVYRMGWTELKPKLAGKPALAVIEAPEVAALLQRIGQSDASEAEGRGLPTAAIMSGLHHEIVLTGRPMQAAADPSDEGDRRLRSAGSLHVAVVRDSQGALRQQVQQLTTLAEAAPSGHVDIAGVVYHPLLGDPESGPPGESTLIAVDQDLIRVATNRAAAEWAHADAAGMLGDNPLFNSAVAPLLQGQAERPIALYYYDLRPVWEALGPAWDQQSWRGIEALAGATFMEERGYRNRHYWKLGARRTGFLQKTQASTVPSEWLRRVPAEATGFASGVWDGPSMATVITAIVGRAMGAESEQISGVPMITRQLQPLLGSLGPRYLVYRMPSRYGGAPLFGLGSILPLNNTVLISEVSDPEGLQRGLEQVMPPLSPIGRVRVGAHEAHVLFAMYNLVYVVPIGQQVMIAFNSQHLRDALDNWDRPGASIVDTPEYRAAAEHLIPDACFQLYLPPGAFSRDLYDHYIPMFEQISTMMHAFYAMQGGHRPQPTAADGPVMFPRGSTIAAHVKEGTIISARDDGAGILFDGYAPVLCTPYYVPYVHVAYTFFGDVGVPMLLMNVLMGGAVAPG